MISSGLQTTYALRLSRNKSTDKSLKKTVLIYVNTINVNNVANVSEFLEEDTIAKYEDMAEFVNEHL